MRFILGFVGFVLCFWMGAILLGLSIRFGILPDFNLVRLMDGDWSWWKTALGLMAFFLFIYILPDSPSPRGLWDGRS
jgi:hypothetical protein